MIPPALGEEKETFAGCRVFEVDDEEYGNEPYEENDSNNNTSDVIEDLKEDVVIPKEERKR